MDARAFFLERQYGDAYAKLDEAYQSYCESRQRILKQDPEKDVDPKAKDRDRQIRRLKRKQDKARELIEKFESFLPQLQRLAEKEQARIDAKQKPAQEPTTEEPPSQSETNEPPSQSFITPDDVDEDFRQEFKKLIGDRQLDLVSGRFGFLPLAAVTDVQVDAVYLLRKTDRCLLVQAKVDPDDPDKVLCVDLCNEKNQTLLSRDALVKLSSKRRLVLLTRK